MAQIIFNHLFSLVLIDDSRSGRHVLGLPDKKKSVFVLKSNYLRTVFSQPFSPLMSYVNLAFLYKFTFCSRNNQHIKWRKCFSFFLSFHSQCKNIKNSQSIPELYTKDSLKCHHLEYFTNIVWDLFDMKAHCKTLWFLIFRIFKIFLISPVLLSPHWRSSQLLLFFKGNDKILLIVPLMSLFNVYPVVVQCLYFNSY